MTTVLKSELGQIITLDVVTKQQKGFRSSVTQHPVDGAGTVSDHATNHNPRISMTAYISAADFNSSKPEKLDSLDRNKIGGEIVVGGSVAQVVEIDGFEESFLQSAIPDIAKQFFEEDKPEIKGITQRSGYELSEFRNLELLHKFKVPVKMYEFDNYPSNSADGSSGTQEIVNTTPAYAGEKMFLTNISVSESPDNGDAYLVNLSFEIVTVTTLQEAEAPLNVAPEIEDESSGKSNEGNQSGFEGKLNEIQEALKEEDRASFFRILLETFS